MKKLVAAAQQQEQFEIQYWETMDLPSLIHPHGLLPAVLLAYSRKKQVPLDEVALVAEVVADNPADDGILLTGISLEGGAEWGAGELVESPSVNLRAPLPRVCVSGGFLEQGEEEEEVLDERAGKYDCPVYCTKARGKDGFLFEIRMRCADHSSLWILKGIAGVAFL